VAAQKNTPIKAALTKKNKQSNKQKSLQNEKMKRYIYHIHIYMYMNAKPRTESSLSISHNCPSVLRERQYFSNSHIESNSPAECGFQCSCMQYDYSLMCPSTLIL
jgi:hypothetical protein